MERLSFDNHKEYDGLEASIHIARYLLAKKVCFGKHVLDVACGEGYGSRLLKDWGAITVDGIDISESAILRARENFKGEDIHFHCSSVENLSEVCGDKRYDLIISLETIEHLHSPENFLIDLKRLLTPKGCLILSCPNDWWYFPSKDEKNPYHCRKYSFDEFRQQAEDILGMANSWLLGAPTFGFLNSIRNANVEVEEPLSQIIMMQNTELNIAHLIPAELGAKPNDKNASYFVGVWGEGVGSSYESAALLPLSMDAFSHGIFQGHFSANMEKDRVSLISENALLTDTVHRLGVQLQVVEDKALLSEKERRNVALRLEATTSENALLADTVHRLGMQLQVVEDKALLSEKERRNVALRLEATISENALLADTVRKLGVQLQAVEEQVLRFKLGHDRYIRLKSLIPSSIFKLLVVIRNRVIR